MGSVICTAFLALLYFTNLYIGLVSNIHGIQAIATITNNTWKYLYRKLTSVTHINKEVVQTCPTAAPALLENTEY